MKAIFSFKNPFKKSNDKNNNLLDEVKNLNNSAPNQQQNNNSQTSDMNQDSFGMSPPSMPDINSNQSMDNNSGSSSLPSFDDHMQQQEKQDNFQNPQQQPNEDPFQNPQQQQNPNNTQQSQQNNDMVVPPPPPELMNNQNPMDENHLKKIEEKYLRSEPMDKEMYTKEVINTRKPIFITIDNYEKSLHNIIDIKANVKEFSEIIYRIENLNDSQNSTYTNFHNMLEEIQRKLIYVDNTIFEKK